MQRIHEVINDEIQARFELENKIFNMDQKDILLESVYFDKTRHKVIVFIEFVKDAHYLFSRNSFSLVYDISLKKIEEKDILVYNASEKEEMLPKFKNAFLFYHKDETIKREDEEISVSCLPNSHEIICKQSLKYAEPRTSTSKQEQQKPNHQQSSSLNNSNKIINYALGATFCFFAGIALKTFLSFDDKVDIDFIPKP